MRNDIEQNARSFFDYKLPTQVQAKNQHSIDTFIETHTDILTRTRDKVSLFKIVGNLSFKEFLEHSSLLHGGFMEKVKPDLKSSLRMETINSEQDIKI